jgi:alpha-ketoglutarate-dependent taurine dioxygenase
VFTASVYPQHRHIPLHCENSYQRDWPMLIAFCCARAAARGGETPIADMTRVTARIPADLLSRFREHGVSYHRYYRPGVDLPWEEVFQTRDRAEVARYCREHGIEHHWHGSAELSTTQRCHGTAIHPFTGSEVFFNQAHLFHASSLGEELEQEMKELFGPDGLPRDARFGNGGKIGRTELAQVRDSFDAEAIAFPWQTGDVLLLDNMQVAHGRRPYEGEREVRVAMSNPYSRCKR